MVVKKIKENGSEATQDLQIYKSELDKVNQLANHEGEEVARLATEIATKTMAISTLQTENRNLRIQNLDIGRLQSDNASLCKSNQKLQESIKEATDKCEKTGEELAKVISSNKDQLKKLQDALADMENRA